MRQVDLPHPSIRAAYLFRATDTCFEKPSLSLLVVAPAPNGDFEDSVWEVIANYCDRNGIERSIVAVDEHA